MLFKWFSARKYAMRGEGAHQGRSPGARRRPRSHARDRLRQGLDIVGGFRVEAVIGQGTTGTVYRARRTGDETGQVVALKRVPPDAAPDVVRRLHGEAMALATLDHPHIVRLIDLVADGAGTATVMEYAAGGSLAGLLATTGRLAGDEVVRVAAPLADALAHAHGHGLVHGDVKPSNVLFTSGGAPLLADFGTARRTGRARDGGEVLGTAGYVDPAVLEGAPVDERSDVYGLGALCHEMLTGRPPGASAVHLLGSPAPPALVAVLRRALARRPADRYPDAKAMGAALRAALGDTPAPPGGVGLQAGPERPGPVVVPPVGPPTRSFGPRPPRPEPPRAPRSPLPERRRIGVAALVVAVAVAGVAAVPSRPRGTTRPAVVACPPVPAPLQADVDGDGCPSAVGWSGNVLEVEGHRYHLGEPGDSVLLGDWDCDGRDTPALYRPDGVVFFFDGWAEDGRPLPAASRGDRLPQGEPEVRGGEDGCDRVVVG